MFTIFAACGASASQARSDHTLSPTTGTTSSVALPECNEFVFGFSPGHVGTTTLASRTTYASGITSLKSNAFFFELARANDTAQFANAEQELHYVRETYLPAMVASIEEQQKAGHLAGSTSMLHQYRKCIDLSHYNLLYYRGLIRLMQQTSARFRFVRVRRDALETARSLSETRKGGSLKPWMVEAGDRFELSAAFHPQRTPSAVLRIPQQPWAGLSALQQALWMTDETEAQWMRHVDPTVRRAALEVEWSKRDRTASGDALRDKCAVPIAESLGLVARPSVIDLKSHVDTHVDTHVDSALDTADLLRADMRELHEYRAIMEAECPAFGKMRARLPSSVAYEARSTRLRAIA